MNRIVVISGTSSGIGKLLARRFEAGGDTVVGLSRSDDGLARHIPLDVTDLSAVKEAADEVKSSFGRVDILVCNAGVGISGATEYLPPDQAASVMAVNYDGTYNLCRAFLPLMGEGSKVVVISSACALFALPYRAVYCAAKAAVTMLSYGLRMELAPAGIDVVTICPGDIRTNFTAHRIKIADGGDRYGARPSSAAARLDRREHKRMDPEKATDKIYRIASRKRGALYLVGGKYKFLRLAKRFLPEGAFLRLTAKFFG